MLKRVLSLLLVLLMVFSLAACSGGGDTNNGGDNEGGEASGDVEQTISFNIISDPTTLDPGLSNVTENSIICTQMYDYLYRESADGGVAPSLAESYTVSDDGLVYTFKLRDGIKFSNGEPITANDFVFTWTRVLDPRTGAAYAYQLTYIKGGAALNSVDLSAADADKQIEDAIANLGLKAIDDKTLEVTLESPTPYFLSLVSFTTYAVLSEKAVTENPNWADDVSTLVTSGPFTLDEWKKGEYLIYKKNPNYWDADNVKLETLKFMMIDSATTEVTLWETGELDITYGNIPVSDMDRFEAEGKLKTQNWVQMYYITLQTEKTPFTDPRVNLALSMALDRTAFCTQVMKAGSIPAEGLIPPGMADVDTSKTFREAGGNLLEENVEKAQQLLAEAGYPNGEGFPSVEFCYTTNEKNKAQVEAIVEMWRTNLNIDVIPVNLEGKVRTEKRRMGDFDMTLNGWVGDYADPFTFFEVFLTGNSYNDGRYSNSEYDALIESTKTELDPNKRFATFHQAEEVLLSTMPIIPLAEGPKAYLEAESVKGVNRSPLGMVDFIYAYKE